jgi:hypothetical protein
MCQKFLVELPKIKFNKNPFSYSQIVADRWQMDAAILNTKTEYYAVCTHVHQTPRIKIFESTDQFLLKSEWISCHEQ